MSMARAKSPLFTAPPSFNFRSCLATQLGSMAPKTRAASRDSAEFALTRLCEDELEVVFNLVSRTLDPCPALALAAASHAVRTAVQPALLRLRERYIQARALLATEEHAPSCAEALTAEELNWYDSGLAPEEFETVGRLCEELPQLRKLYVAITRRSHHVSPRGVRYLASELHDPALTATEGVQRLALQLHAGALPSLTVLGLGFSNLGEASAAALAAAMGRGALPMLQELYLFNNPITSKGLVALAPQLMRLPDLAHINLDDCQIGDDGLLAMVAPPVSTAFKSLVQVDLTRNLISDAGCAALADAIKGGALPAIKRLSLYHNPASIAAVEAVQHARNHQDRRSLE